MNTTVTERLRGTLVPWAAWTMKNWCATPSPAPQLMPRRAAGRWQMNSRSVPAAACPAPAKGESAAARSALLCALSADEETQRQEHGLGRGEHQSSSESILGKYPWEGDVGGKIPSLGEYPLLLSSAAQLWQSAALESSVLLFPSVLL